MSPNVEVNDTYITVELTDTLTNIEASLREAPGKTWIRIRSAVQRNSMSGRACRPTHRELDKSWRCARELGLKFDTLNTAILSACRRCSRSEGDVEANEPKFSSLAPATASDLRR